MPRVSVIIPSYNCARFLERALDSVEAQTYPDREIIVVDDGSTDNTRDIVSGWGRDVRYIFQENQGPSAARNRGISAGSGEFIAYLDADDMWQPKKLEQQVAFLDSHPECGMVHTSLSVVDENDVPIFHDWYKENNYRPLSGHCLPDILRACLVQCPTVMERRTCYDRSGGFNEGFTRSEDYLHWIQIVLEGFAIGFINKPLTYYRRRSGSLTQNYADMVAAMIEMYELLLQQHSVLEQGGREAEEIIRERLASLREVLPYFYRVQGNNRLARRHAAVLVRELPGRVESYIQYLLSCIPTPLYEALRMVRNRFQKPNMFIREDR